MNIEPCDRCGKLDGIKWRRSWMWQCKECLSRSVPAIACKKCGGEARVCGIERFQKLQAGCDDYALSQRLGFRCEDGHVTIDRYQCGPGSSKGGASRAIVWPLRWLLKAWRSVRYARTVSR